MAIAALMLSVVAACAGAAPSPARGPAAISSPTPFVPPRYVPPSYVPPSYVPPSYVPPSYVPPSYVPPIVRPPDPFNPPPSNVPPGYVPPSYVPPSFVPAISRPPDTFNSPPPGAQSGPPQAGGTSGPPPGGSCAAVSAVASAPVLSGTSDLFDQHLHEYFAGGPNNAPLDVSAQVTMATGVAQTLVFVVRGQGTYDDCLVRQGLQRYPGRILPFAVPRVITADEIDQLRLAIEAADSPYRGVGELAFYRSDFDGVSLSSGPAAAAFDALFRSLEQRGLPVFIHLRNGQDADFAAMMRAHPALKVGMHGYPSPDATAVATLLRTYPNVSYSLDTAMLNITGLADLRPGISDQQRQTGVDAAWAFWKGLMTAFPDRVMWGTDAGPDYDTDMYRPNVEFARAFIAKLPVDLQRGYAYANAARFWGIPR